MDPDNQVDPARTVLMEAPVLLDSPVAQDQ